jgi:hypothetical protein
MATILRCYFQAVVVLKISVYVVRKRINYLKFIHYQKLLLEEMFRMKIIQKLILAVMSLFNPSGKEIRALLLGGGGT